MTNERNSLLKSYFFKLKNFFAKNGTARANQQRTTDSTNYQRYKMTHIEYCIGMCEGVENDNLLVHFMLQTLNDCATYDCYGLNLALRIQDVITSRFVPENNVREEFDFKLDDWESHIPNDPMDCSPDQIPNDPMDCSP